MHSSTSIDRVGKGSFDAYFAVLKRLLWLGGLSVLPLAIALFVRQPETIRICQIAALMCWIPFLGYSYFLTILHWKERYRGVNSGTWGVLLLLHFGGCSQLAYLLRHLLPDCFDSGRYAGAISRRGIF